MTRTKEERYLEWLEREEETLGLDDMLRASEDVEYARILLKEELGYDPTDAQVDAFYGAATTKYEVLPEVGVHYSRIEHSLGFQSTYRDVETGRFISRAELESRLAERE